MLMSFMGLSSAATRLELSFPQRLQRWMIAHSPFFRTHTATGSIGDVIEYQILSMLPSITSRATSFSEYTYTDTLSAGLSYRKNDVRVEWFSDRSCTEESRVAVWTEQDGKFAVSYSALGDKSVMRIKMTDAGLEELNNSDAVYDPNTSLYLSLIHI